MKKNPTPGGQKSTLQGSEKKRFFQARPSDRGFLLTQAVKTSKALDNPGGINAKYFPSGEKIP